MSDVELGTGMKTMKITMEMMKRVKRMKRRMKMRF
jgi:hypothetical protein